MSASQSHGERTCARDECVEKFTPKTARRIYCSDSCRAQVAKRSVSKSPVIRVRAAPAPQPSVQAWEPPSQARGAVETGEPCPDCAALLWTKGRGTVRVCLACKPGRKIPRGVATPYERGTAAVRQVRSQRERDLDAIELAKRKGVMLAQLGQLADDDRLHPESHPVVEWFAEQVKAATAGARLDDLAALLPDAGIRRRGWWQRNPAAITAGPYDGEDADDGQDDDDDYLDSTADQGINDPPAREDAKVWPVSYSSSAAVRAWTRPGPAGGMSWADALAVLGWRLARSGSGCQVSEGAAACGAQTERGIDGALVCYGHYQSLAAAIMARPAGPMTWPDAIAACGWRLSATAGACQIVEHSALCGAGTAHRVASATGAGGWVCSRHYAVLCQVITDYGRSA